MPKTPCPHCGAVLKLPENYAATSARCPKCQKPFELPAQRSEQAKASSKPAATAPAVPERKCAKCGGTEDLLSGRFHAAKEKYVADKKKQYYGDHTQLTTTIRYEGVLNISDWVCAPCVTALEKEHRRVGLTAAGVIIAAVIAWFFVPLESGSIASLLRMGAAVIVGFLLQIAAIIALIAWLKGSDLWSIDPRSSPGMANSFALRCNKRKLREQGYKHFGTGHMEDARQKEALEALRRLMK